MDACHKKHGHPLRTIKNGVIDEDVDDSSSMISQKEEKCEKIGILFTPEQQKAIMAMIQQASNSQQQHSVNQIHTTTNSNPNTGISQILHF